MRKQTAAFEPRNLFRNVYFWLAVGGAIFLLYVGFIAFTFLPRSTSEVTGEKTTDSNAPVEKTVEKEIPKKRVSASGTGELSKAKFDLIKNGGWVDSDDQKMTIVMRVYNLKPSVTDEIIKSGGIEIEIDGATATIINSEPYKNNGFLTRVEAVMSDEKFSNFKNGKTQSIEIITSISYDGDKPAINVLNRRFAKQNKVEVEGVKIDWKK